MTGQIGLEIRRSRIAARAWRHLFTLSRSSLSGDIDNNDTGMTSSERPYLQMMEHRQESGIEKRSTEDTIVNSGCNVHLPSTICGQFEVPRPIAQKSNPFLASNGTNLMTYRGKIYKPQEIREDIELVSYWSAFLESSPSPSGNTLVDPDPRSTVHSL
jgi:hypothetical protein